MLRLRLTFKGLLAIGLAFLAFLLGAVLGHAYLNLAGYVLMGALLVGTAMGLFAIQGVRIRAVASRQAADSGEADVWVSLDSRSSAGPFGLDVEGYAGPERVVHSPERAGQTFRLRESPERLFVELRSLPLGLTEISRRVPVAWLPPSGEASDLSPDARAMPGGSEPDGRIREHRPGEGFRRVHWPLTARLQRLIVRVQEPALDERPRPVAERFTVALPEAADFRLDVVRAFTILATLGAIAFLWQQGALQTSAVAILFPLVMLGGTLSYHRAGKPSKPMLLALYIGILALLAFFVSDLRTHVLSREPIALTVMGVAALFAWDLRDRSYVRAQLFLVVFASILLPAFFPARDGAGVGLAFAGVMLALLLAAWAEGRHDIGATRVRLAELGSLTSALIPLAFFAAMVLVLHPWLPAIPLPSLPTFGLAQVRAASGELAARVPGQQGRVDLDARWPQESRPAVEVTGGSERLRAEVFETYREGEWLASESPRAAWPDPEGQGTWARITLKADALRVLPLPPGTLALREALLDPTRHADGTVRLSRPAWNGYTFEAHVGRSALSDRRPPSPAERATASHAPELQALARQLAGDAPTPLEAMERIAHHLRSAYRYDLQAPPAPAGEDAVWHFLTESRRGFCVHYASALALIGRELGVPTRFVAGYSAGRQVGDVTVFEARHAHAWVEAYLDGHWVTFDPTPSAGFAVPVGAKQGRLLLGAGMLLGVIGLLWRRHREPAFVRRYRGILRRLQQRGAPVTEATTPREALAYGATIMNAQEWQAFRELVEQYERARFDGR